MPPCADPIVVLGLLVMLLPWLELAEPPPVALAALPPGLVGRALEPGACARALTGDTPYGVIGRVPSRASSERTEALLVQASDASASGRVGGCPPDKESVRVHLAWPALRPIAAPPVSDDAQAGDGLEPVPDRVSHRCVTRETLRPYASLALLDGPLAGFALELAPGRNSVSARLVDHRSPTVTTYGLGKIGARTLEWCDRTDVAEGHCPNPTHGAILHVALIDDHLVVTLALGRADLCGQDDLVFKALPLPVPIRRSLR